MKSTIHRERMMIAGMFLSKFDRKGLSHLGFASFSEAFNAMGYALGGRPASVKNYMQEFDPMFPNERKGWHKRPLRHHCRAALDRYGHLSLSEFSHLLLPLIQTPAVQPEGFEELSTIDDENLENESFSKRLITGAAAEGFFELSFPKLKEFTNCIATNVTRLGCGFDFRLVPPDDAPFLAIEVKGISGVSGEVMMSHKEHRVAKYLRDRYFLCIVRNFIEKPAISIIQNPLESDLEFAQRERQHTTISWHTKICN